jgi:pyrimidine-specific ribonucleoside hydrolase
VQVELAPGYSRGQTLVDRRVTGGEDDVHQGTRKHWPRVDVAMETVPEKVLDLFFSTISA